MKRIAQLFRQKYQSVRNAWQSGQRALKPLFDRAYRDIGPNELAMGFSIVCVAWGLVAIYPPLGPIFVGLSVLAIAVINSRMK